MPMQFMESSQILKFLFITVAFNIRQNRVLVHEGVIKRDRQFTYNRKLGRVCATVVAVEKESVLFIHRICLQFRSPSCNTHAL